MDTLRRSRVSVAIRPLLGNPSRTPLLSEGFLSTFPFTKVTGDAAEQYETENFTQTQLLAEDDGVEKGEIGGAGRLCRKNVRITGISSRWAGKSLQRVLYVREEEREGGVERETRLV